MLTSQGSGRLKGFFMRRYLRKIRYSHVRLLVELGQQWLSDTINTFFAWFDHKANNKGVNSAALISQVSVSITNFHRCCCLHTELRKFLKETTTTDWLVNR